MSRHHQVCANLGWGAGAHAPGRRALRRRAVAGRPARAVAGRPGEGPSRAVRRRAVARAVPAKGRRAGRPGRRAVAGRPAKGRRGPSEPKGRRGPSSGGGLSRAVRAEAVAGRPSQGPSLAVRAEGRRGPSGRRPCGPSEPEGPSRAVRPRAVAGRPAEGPSRAVRAEGPCVRPSRPKGRAGRPSRRAVRAKRRRGLVRAEGQAGPAARPAAGPGKPVGHGNRQPGKAGWTTPGSGSTPAAAAPISGGPSAPGGGSGPPSAGGWRTAGTAARRRRNGLAIIRWDWAASCGSGGSGASWVPRSSLRSAEASASGSPDSSAPPASAPYSRDRLTAICTTPGGDRPEQRDQQRGQRVGPVVVGAAEQAGEHGHVGQEADHRGQRPGHRGDQDVPVVDVAQLVCQHRPQLALVEQVQQAGGGADRGVARVAAGGERVRRRGRADVEPRHRLAGRPGQLAHDPVHRRVLGLGDRPGVHGAQRERVGAEVGVAVQRRAPRRARSAARLRPNSEPTSSTSALIPPSSSAVFSPLTACARSDPSLRFRSVNAATIQRAGVPALSTPA